MIARMEAIAARELVRLRDGWLNPPDLDPAALAVRTLTNLYNQRPTWPRTRMPHSMGPSWTHTAGRPTWATSRSSSGSST
jgi:hypothetical protein